jgi:hypothetical protein
MQQIGHQESTQNHKFEMQFKSRMAQKTHGRTIIYAHYEWLAFQKMTRSSTCPRIVLIEQHMKKPRPIRCECESLAASTVSNFAQKPNQNHPRLGKDPGRIAAFNQGRKRHDSVITLTYSVLFGMWPSMFDKSIPGRSKTAESEGQMADKIQK